jgi:hypothetical protein
MSHVRKCGKLNLTSVPPAQLSSNDARARQFNPDLTNGIAQGAPTPMTIANASLRPKPKVAIPPLAGC